MNPLGLTGYGSNGSVVAKLNYFQILTESIIRRTVDLGFVTVKSAGVPSADSYCMSTAGTGGETDGATAAICVLSTGLVAASGEGF